MPRPFVVELLGIVLACAVPAVAADLIVDRNNPGAYQSLQAALDAALPGDRILIRSPEFLFNPGIITKSVTIRGEATPYTIATMDAPALEIRSLTAGIPLVLEDVTILVGATAFSAWQAGIFTRTPIVGEIVMDGVWLESGRNVLYEPRPAVDVQTTRLAVRRSYIHVEDTLDNNACCEELYRNGRDALRFQGDELFVEDSYLRAGSGNQLLYSAGCFGLCPEAGFS